MLGCAPQRKPSRQGFDTNIATYALLIATMFLTFNTEPITAGFYCCLIFIPVPETSMGEVAREGGKIHQIYKQPAPQADQ